jgi:hypothetical protein
MSDPDVLTVRSVAPGPVRFRWCRSLAYAVTATPGPSGVVFEATNHDPVPWVTVRPRSLIETFRAALPRGRNDLVPCESSPTIRPPCGWANRIRYVVSPVSTDSSVAYLSEVGRDFPDLEPLVGPVGWLGVQTHWVRASSGELWVARRFCLATPDEEELAMRIESVALAVAADWTRRIGAAATTRAATRGGARDWRRGTVRTVPRDAWRVRSADRVAATADFPFVPAGDPALVGEGHGVVFGASGAGKTTFLSRLAAHEIASGHALVVIDLHGDLVPSIVARLPTALRAKVVAVDATSPPVPGIAALTVGGTADDLAAAHLVAALKRLSPDGAELHWGFRLERILDTFTRLAQESGGSLLDLFDLLTDPVRRDAARLATRRADLARFLDELAPILRRQPDFLWSAATRLSKVVLVPGLAELLAPSDGGLPVEELVDQERPLLVRLPFATLGPESAAFAGSLVLARIYLGLAARRRVGFAPRRVRLLLDEAQGFSPRLVCELLTESRKFGLRVLLATQFPDRLAPEVRAAAAGALADFVTFRVPPTVAGAVGGWVGLSREEAERWLPGLPVGYGVRLDPTTGTARSVPPGETFVPEDRFAWPEVVERTRDEFDVPPSCSEGLRAREDLTERLLLAVLAAEERGRPLAPSEAVAAAVALPGPFLGPELLGDRWRDLLRQDHVVVTDGRCRLTDAGQRRLGLLAPTGAVRESSEHRALLLAVFRLFAHRGYSLEILRQGRFDTTLPDAVFHQLSRRSESSPAELADTLDRIRHGWAWRCFGGRDVHVEVEVSGALRPERVRRGWRKASRRGAFALFVVGDAGRAHRVRATLRGLGVGPDRAQVWTLSLPGRPCARTGSTDRANP